LRYPAEDIVDAQREAQLLEHLRLAEKMVDYVCEYSQIKSELDKSTVFSAAIRAKAALREAKAVLEKKDDPADPPAAG
jgi:hypothetical protein